ncbi:hypothetical protein L1987_81510 [Smallanthus sonchifolius]|uniref:Uncharacterized protein n=1 Tax=Smallanthus sonchifolius TaxID=185202 RepID=A0ACB8YRA2_9ASTR|nr:hypothetical protein L1987_81510 [Smallanthus sonchifolius]
MEMTCHRHRVIGALKHNLTFWVCGTRGKYQNKKKRKPGTPLDLVIRRKKERGGGGGPCHRRQRKRKKKMRVISPINLESRRLKHDFIILLQFLSPWNDMDWKTTVERME